MRDTRTRDVLAALNLSQARMEDAHVSILTLLDYIYVLTRPEITLSCSPYSTPLPSYPRLLWNKIYTAFLLFLADGSSRRNRPSSGNFA